MTLLRTAIWTRLRCSGPVGPGVLVRLMPDKIDKIGEVQDETPLLEEGSPLEEGSETSTPDWGAKISKERAVESPMEPVKPRNLTRLQRGFVKNLAETGKISESALRAGSIDPTYGSHLLRNENVQLALMEAYDKAGISDGYIVSKIKQGMNAKYPPRKDGGRQYPDYFTRKHYIDMFFKTTGGYAPEKHEVSEKRIIIVMSPGTVKGLVDAKAISEDEGDFLDAEIVEQGESSKS